MNRSTSGVRIWDSTDPPCFLSSTFICCLSCCPLRCGSQERNCVPGQQTKVMWYDVRERTLEDKPFPRSSSDATLRPPVACYRWCPNCLQGDRKTMHRFAERRGVPA